MIPLIIISIALPVCLVIIVLSCLSCFQKPKFQNFQNRQVETAHNNPSFTIDISDAQASNERVTIEELPDILAKTSIATPQRPRMTLLGSSQQDATLTLISVQRSFPRDQIQYLNEVESGWFGKVLDSEASKIVGGTVKSRVMVKMLKDDATQFEQKQFLDEVLAFRCLEHTNVLSLLGQCVETAPFLVLLEFAPHGNLKTFLIEHRMEADVLMKKHRLLSFAVDAAAGLACLHRHGYVHNDLSARNCLVMSDYTVKIGDYGISEVIFKEDYMKSGTELLPIRWMAPESLIQSQGIWTAQPGDKVSDIWSLGITIWEIFSLGDRPYDMLTDEAVLQGVVLDRLVKPAELDTRLAERDRLWLVMSQCWLEPNQRVQIEQVYEQLDSLTSARRDTLAMDSIDFEDRWKDLHPNKRPSSIDTDLGSRLGLAGSFATDNSSPPSLNADALSDFTESTGSKVGDIEEDLANLTSVSKAPDKGNSSGGGEGVLNITDVSVDMEPEVTVPGSSEAHIAKPASAVDVDGSSGDGSMFLTPTRPVAIASSTPAGPDSLEGSSKSLMSSTPGSLYATVSEGPTSPRGSGQEGSLVTSTDSSNQSFHDIPDKTLVPDANSNNAEQQQHELANYSDFVQSSPTSPRADFTEFESAPPKSSFESEEVDKVVGKSAISADFSDFVSPDTGLEGIGDNFSMLSGFSETTASPTEVATDADKPLFQSMTSPQTLDSQFESLNLASLMEDKPKAGSLPSAAQTANVNQDTGLLVPTAEESSAASKPEGDQTTQDPLMDEDVDQLLNLSMQPSLPASEPLSLEDQSVPSLSSNPSLPDPGIAVEALIATDIAPKPVASGLADVTEQPSLIQSLDSLPTPVIGSVEELMTALGEQPLDSHLLSIKTSNEESLVNLQDSLAQPVTPAQGNLLDDFASPVSQGQEQPNSEQKEEK